MQKWNKQTDSAQRVDEKKGHLSCYYVYSQIYGDQNIKNSSFFALPADASQKSVTVWRKYLRAPERSF